MDSSSVPENIHHDKEAELNRSSESDKRAKRKDVPSSNGGASSQPTQPKKKLSLRSPVWEHFTKTKENNDKCKCHYCHKLFCCATSSGTSNLQKHLGSCKQYAAWKQNQNQPIIDQEGHLQHARVSEEVFRDASNEMLLLGELPLAFVESMAWRHFCNRVNLFKPHSRRTATRDIVQMYVSKKATLKDWICSNKQRVSLTTDIWVAQATGASYMVITIHFIDASWNLRKLIIWFKYIQDHKGKTIASVLLDCLSEWGIEKIFTITVDNATANTSALKKFQSEFKLLGNDALVMDGEFMHMRCCAQIINLIVKDGLQELGDNVAAIHNAVQYVRSSTARCNSFEMKVVSGKMTRGSLPLDIKTRWNSTYLMLKRALTFKTAFDKMEIEDRLYNDYFLEINNGRKRVGPPSFDDWNAIERLVKFLVVFYNSTLVVSASTTVSSYKCYGEIVTIEKNLMSLSNSLDTDLKSKADDMRKKVEKYWDGMEHINKFLIVATVFDPRKKMQFAKMCFEKLYGKGTLEAKRMYDSVYHVLRSLFVEYSSRFSKPPSVASSQSDQTSSSCQEYQDVVIGNLTELVDDDMEYERMDFAYKEMVDEIRVEDEQDELDIYLKENIENPITFVGT